MKETISHLKAPNSMIFSPDNIRLYMDSFIVLKLASNMSFCVKRKDSGKEVDYMEIFIFFREKIELLFVTNSTLTF